MKQTNIDKWLFFAKSDLKAAEDMLKEAIYHLVCFHSQQVIEKCFKAMISSQGKPTHKIHSLKELWKKMEKPEIIWSDLETSPLMAIDRYYLPTRYPDALPGSLPEGLPTKKHAEEALAVAEKIYHDLVSYMK